MKFPSCVSHMTFPVWTANAIFLLWLNASLTCYRVVDRNAKHDFTFFLLSLFAVPTDHAMLYAEGISPPCDGFMKVEKNRVSERDHFCFLLLFPSYFFQRKKRR